MAWRPRVLSIARAVDRAVELGCNFLLLTAGLGLLCLLTVVVVLRYAFAIGFDIRDGSHRAFVRDLCHGRHRSRRPARRSRRNATPAA